MDKALEKQKVYFSEKHRQILQKHSDLLNDKHEENFNNSIKFYKAEIENLKVQLVSEKKKFLVFYKAKAVYSPLHKDLMISL